MNGIFTSACVIVKNEAENLPRWLNCMRALADEMIVVDTGSTDNTVALAEAAGARVCHFTWRDDFAAAKNFTMEQARGRWLFLLDADEYIVPDDYAAVRQTLRDYDQRAEVLGFVTPLINIDTDQQNRRKSEGHQTRIFRRLPALRYQGAVHETLVYQGPGRRRMQLVTSFAIWHTGYSSHIIRSKAERNLHILLARQAREGAQPLDDSYLADYYYTLGDYAQTAQHAAWAAQQLSQDTERGPRAYTLWLQALSNLQSQSVGTGHRGSVPRQCIDTQQDAGTQQGRSAEQSASPEAELEAVLVQAEQAFPLLPDFRVLVGFTAWRRGNYARAEQLLQTGLVRYADFLAHREAQQTTLDSEMPGLLPNVCWELATIAHWRGHHAEALALAAQGIAANRYLEANVQLWLRLQAEAGAAPADIISALTHYYDKKRDAAFLLTLIPHTLPQVRLYYARQGGATLSAGASYLLAGRLPAAAASLTEDFLCRSQLAVLALAQGGPSSVRPWLSRAYDTAYATIEAQTAAQRRWARLQA